MVVVVVGIRRQQSLHRNGPRPAHVHVRVRAERDAVAVVDGGDDDDDDDEDTSLQRWYDEPEPEPGSESGSRHDDRVPPMKDWHWRQTQYLQKTVVDEGFEHQCASVNESGSGLERWNEYSNSSDSAEYPYVGLPQWGSTHYYPTVEEEFRTNSVETQRRMAFLDRRLPPR